MTATIDLPCPECATTGAPGRIGSRRSQCRTCNRYGQAVRREVARRLRDKYPDAAEVIRRDAEKIVYESMMKQGEGGHV